MFGRLHLDLPQTVTAGNAGSHHNRGWEQFTREILKAVAKHAAGSDAKSMGGPLDALLQGKQPKQPSGHPVVFLAWGQPAARSLADAGISEVRFMILQILILVPRTHTT